MSFISTLKDYTEIINTITDSLGSEFSLHQLFLNLLTYIFKTIQYCFFYLISFQWIRDFTLLPLIIPKISDTILAEKIVLEPSGNSVFNFLEIPSLIQNKFVLGFLNSFFLSLPFSVIHLIAIRRLFIQGLEAATYSIGGYLLGQWVFLCCVLFGLRSILVPWLTFEPLNYILGFIIVFRVVYRMHRESLAPLTGWKHPRYRDFFLTSFLLAWCQQTCVFQYLSSVTVSSQSSVLESFSTTTILENFVVHSFYVFGLFVGTIFFTFVWGCIGLQLKKFFMQNSTLTKSSTIQTFNKVSRVLILTLSLTSVPFYSFEHFLAGPLGFISNDKAFENTFFYPYYQENYYQQNIDQKNSDQTDFNPTESTIQFDIDTSTSAFDSSRYLIFPDDPKHFSFEDYNYQGEESWTERLPKSEMADDRLNFTKALTELLKKKDLNKQQIGENIPDVVKFEDQSEYSNWENEPADIDYKTKDKYDKYLPEDVSQAQKQEVLVKAKKRFPEWYNLNVFQDRYEEDQKEFEFAEREIVEKNQLFLDKFLAGKLGQEEQTTQQADDDDVDKNDSETKPSDSPEKRKIRDFDSYLREVYFTRFREQSFPPLEVFGQSEENRPDGDVEAIIKAKYYDNPLYKRLLDIDVDLFLNRQPKEFKLTPSQELDLYRKRALLTTYYNSLRDYSKVYYCEPFETFFEGSKSFASKVYNQQFKGTLRTVRRLFALTTPDSNIFLRDDEDSLNSRIRRENSDQILKFDQPLYNFSSNWKSSLYHEELSKNDEELENELEKAPFNNFIGPPFYAGWDEELRKVVLTNRFLTEEKAGYQMSLDSSVAQKFSSPIVANKGLKSEKNKTSREIFFTAWPLSKDPNFLSHEEILAGGSSVLKNTKESIPYVTLYREKGDPRFFDPAEKPEDEPRYMDIFELVNEKEALPSNIETLRRFELAQRDQSPQNMPGQTQKLKATMKNPYDYLAPKRGGFVWPGNRFLDSTRFTETTVFTKIQKKLQNWLARNTGSSNAN